MTCAHSHHSLGKTFTPPCTTMFQKDTLDALFAELDTAYGKSLDYERLLRETHLGIALSDAGRDYDAQIDQRVASLIKKHQNSS